MPRDLSTRRPGLPTQLAVLRHRVRSAAAAPAARFPFAFPCSSARRRGTLSPAAVATSRAARTSLRYAHLTRRPRAYYFTAGVWSAVPRLLPSRRAPTARGACRIGTTRPALCRSSAGSLARLRRARVRPAHAPLVARHACALAVPAQPAPFSQGGRGFLQGRRLGGALSRPCSCSTRFNSLQAAGGIGATLARVTAALHRLPMS